MWVSDAGPDDHQLEDYLLGRLPDADAERLDELSIVDDQVASRLQVVEDELVDAYVSGELAGETLKRFEAAYLSSERRREKVRFARTLLGTDRNAASATSTGPRESIRKVAPPSAHSPASIAHQTIAHRSIAHRLMVPWRLPVAAVLLLGVSGWLLYDNAVLRNGLRDAQQASAESSHRALDLERRLDDQQVARTEAVKQPEAPAAPDLPVIALVLLPQTRSAGPIATLAVPQATDRVALELQIDPSDFRQYQVALQDPGTNQIVWRSDTISVRTLDNVPTVSVIIPAAVLKAQHYSLQLDGLHPARAPEVIGSYAFQVVRR